MERNEQQVADADQRCRPDQHQSRGQSSRELCEGRRPDQQAEHVGADDVGRLRRVEAEPIADLGRIGPNERGQRALSTEHTDPEKSGSQKDRPQGGLAHQCDVNERLLGAQFQANKQHPEG